MKLAIVLPDTLPVPAVRGGAVQTGVQQLVEENEKFGKINLTIVSVFDEEAQRVSKNYVNTKFIFIKSNNKLQKIFLKTINFTLNKLNIKKRFDITPGFTKKIKNKLSEDSYNAILIKNAIHLVLPLSYKFDNVYLQLHNDKLNSKTHEGKKIFINSKKVLVNSDYIKKQVQTIGDINDEKILINKNCTDLNIFNGEKNYEKQKYYKDKFSIKENDVVILYSGRIIPEKGIKELLLALKKIPTHINYKLLVVGSRGFGETKKDEYLSYLQTISKDIADKIVFTGYIPYKELPFIHSISSIVVVPSIWEEPAGRVVIEAEASGIPVIVSDSGGISDYISEKSSIIINRDSDFISNLSIAIEKLLTNEELRQEMGKEGHEFAKDFDSKNYYFEVIEYMKLK